jgi:serine/threonine protein kinase
MPVDPPAFVESLRDHQLLSSGRIGELTGSLQPQFADTSALAKELIERGWLTSFQVDQVLKGQAHRLTLGPYLLLEVLGEGGMGQVFKAMHRLMHRVVALKVIRQEWLADPESVSRFQREIRALAQLSHPNIVAAYHADKVDDRYFLVMEYVEGTDLNRLVKEGGPLPVDRACDFVRQAALGLQHAYERGLVHRDIKPGNILVTRQGEVKVLDLGLALIGRRPEEGQTECTATTSREVVRGTVDFMAPEQALSSHHVDICADIYSLGCTLYFLLTGRPPFGGSIVEKLVLHQQAEPVAVELLRQELPPLLPRVLRTMMAKQAKDRYQTPAEVAAALAPFCQVSKEGSSLDRQAPAGTSSIGLREDTDSHPQSAPTPRRGQGQGGGPTDAAFRARKKRRRLALVGVAGVILLGIVGGMLAWLRPWEPHVLLVAQQGEGQYLSIKEAIKNAPKNTRILVRPGTYRESLVIDRDVEIVGDGDAKAIVIEATDETCLLMKTPSAVVRNLTLRSKIGPKGGQFPAVRIPHGQLTLDHCDVVGGVVLTDKGAKADIKSCKINGNETTIGIAITDQAAAHIVGDQAK